MVAATATTESPSSTVVALRARTCSVSSLGTGEIDCDCEALKSFSVSPTKSKSTFMTMTTPTKTKTTPTKTSTSATKSPSNKKSLQFVRRIFSKLTPTKTASSSTSTSTSTPTSSGRKKSLAKQLTSSTAPLDDSSREVFEVEVEVDGDGYGEEDLSSTDIVESQSSSSASSSASSSSSSILTPPPPHFDTTTDLAYHNQQEYDDCTLIWRQHLSNAQLMALPDKFMVLRHYRAEKGSISKTIAAIKHTLEWREEFGLQKILHVFDDYNSSNKTTTTANNNTNDNTNHMAKVIRREGETGKVYVRGYDKDGRACVYLRPGKENTNFESEYNNLAHLVFQLEKAVACSQKNGQGKICLIIDYDGFTLSKSPPMSTSKKTLDILQQHYCERMYRAYVCNPPLYFRTFWAMIKPFVDPVTKKKVCFCHGKVGLQQIVDDVGGPEKAHRQLERCAGGTNKQMKEFNIDEYLALPMNVAFDED